MTTRYLLITFTLSFLFGCKARPDQSTTVSTADSVDSPLSRFYGNWLCKDYLDELHTKRNSDYNRSITQPHFFELMLSENSKDSVWLLNRTKKLEKFAAKVIGTDTLLVYSQANDPLIFVYDRFTDQLNLKNTDQENRRKVRPDCIFEKAKAKYLNSTSSFESTFDWAVNENTVANNYVNTRDTTGNITSFTFDGTISGLDDYEKFNVCIVNCLNGAKFERNIIYLTANDKSQPFAWRISGNYDTLYIYSLKESEKQFIVDKLKYKLVVTKPR
ncbi:hypothetical protein NF867_13985 [Solitalea sp. MAHUQ-68]|uniref:Lipoprotein n=1 Tax=Solitalea agri TaxID=2953739 RepID=A0A9X2F7V8_9SPHI|nr:hypothetical protein [Solitalea agri]MCO4293971.1 hypothetical protein [Solitalea agri]